MEDFVIFTDAAISFIKNSVEREQCLGIRIDVAPGGCQGMTYKVQLVHDVDESDVLIQKDGVNVYIAAKAIVFVAGMTVDYSGSLMGSGLIFSNPNAKSKCGCGKSFCTEESASSCGGKCGG